MAAKKEFILGWKVDTRGLKDAYKALQDLAGMGNKVAKSYSGINLGVAGGAGVKAGLSKALLDSPALFKKLGDSGKSLAKILKDDVTANLSLMEKALSSSTAKIEILTRQAEAAERRFQQNRLSTKAHIYQSERDTLKFRLKREMGENASIEHQVGLLGSEDKPKGMLGKVFDSPFGNMASNFFGGQLGGMAMRAGTGGIAAYAVYKAAKEAFKSFETGAGYQFGSEARLGTSQAGMYSQALHGDGNYLYARARIAGDADAADRFGSAQTLAGLGTGVGGFFKALAFGGPFTPGGSARMGSLNTDIEAAKRAREAEILGEIAQGGGADAVRATTRQQLAPAAVKHSRMYGKMAWQGASMASGKYAVNFEELLGAQGIMAQGIGRGGDGTAMVAGTNAVALANNFGMSTNAAARILAGTAVGGGDILGRMNKSGMDAILKEMLGNNIAGSISNSGSLLTDGNGYYSALMSGVGGGKEGIRALSQNISGMQSMGGMMGGFDPYQKSVNLANAITNMPGGSVYGQNALAKLGGDPRVLADILGNGKVPQALLGMGMTAGNIRAQANDSVNSLMNRYVDQGGGGEAARLADEISKSPLGLSGWLKKNGSKKNIETLSGLFGEMAPEMFPEGYGQAEGWLRDVGGLGGGRSGGGGGKGKGPADRAGDMPELKSYKASLLTTSGELLDLGKHAKRARDELGLMADQQEKERLEREALRQAQYETGNYTP